VVKDSLAVLINVSVNYVVLRFSRRGVGAPHDPQANAGKPLDESQDGPVRLWLDWAVVACRGTPSHRSGDNDSNGNHP
jgi:hypothetical protein